MVSASPFVGIGLGEQHRQRRLLRRLGRGGLGLPRRQRVARLLGDVGRVERVGEHAEAHRQQQHGHDRQRDLVAIGRGDPGARHVGRNSKLPAPPSDASVATLISRFAGGLATRISALSPTARASAILRPIVLIPARMASTRLPRKPLADIHGAPMIVHVWRRAREADVGPVVVAADDAAIVEAVEAAGGRAMLTRADHASGSDRIAEALARLDPDRALRRRRQRAGRPADHRAAGRARRRGAGRAPTS